MTPEYVDDFARALLVCGYRVTSAVIRPDGTGELEVVRKRPVSGARSYIGLTGEPARKRTAVQVQRMARRAAAVTALCRWLRPARP
jgi:hypothetical protein